MLDIIVKTVFYLIGKIGDIILMPIMAVISIIAPDLTLNLDHVFTYLENGFQFVPFFLKLFLIPSPCIDILILVFTLYVLLIFSIRTFNFLMKIYKNFRP